MEITKVELDKRLQEILNNFDVPQAKRRDYKFLRDSLTKFENNRDFQEAKALIIKLLVIENEERLKFIKR